MKHAICQPVTHSHAEAACNSIVGLIIAQIMLVFGFGFTMERSLVINITFIAVSYARAFVIRRLFARLG
jgi:Ca2+/Na+ antiporter